MKNDVNILANHWFRKEFLKIHAYPTVIGAITTHSNNVAGKQRKWMKMEQNKNTEMSESAESGERRTQCPAGFPPAGFSGLEPCEQTRWLLAQAAAPPCG